MRDRFICAQGIAEVYHINTLRSVLSAPLWKSWMCGPGSVRRQVQSEPETSARTGKKNRLLVVDRVWSTWDPTSKSRQRFSLKVPIRLHRRDATGQF